MTRLKSVLLGFMACCIGALASPAYAQDSVDIKEVESWLRAYEVAWEERDPDKAVQIFTEDATYQVDPYSEPHVGHSGIRQYWADVTSDQRDVEFSAEVLAVTENTGIAHWHAELTQASSGALVTLDGIFVLEFSAQGKCSSLREWWHVQVEQNP